jgi:hypothetical protein
MNVTAEYQVTLDEFTEVVRRLQGDIKKQQFGGRRFIGWIVFIGLAIVLFVFLRSRQQSRFPYTPPPAAAPASDKVFELFLTLLPWILIGAFLWFFLFLRLRRRYQKAFDKTPGFHRVRTIHITDDGLTMTEPTLEWRATWAHYVRFAETKNLFLLYVGDVAAEFIPKRIFPDESAVTEFRSILEQNISPPSGAFPVLPVRAPD